MDAREVALGCAPRRAPLHQLRAREGDHVERMVPRPVEQVLHEVEQARVRPLHVLECEHGGIDLREALEEQPPGRKQVLSVGAVALGQPEELGEARLDEGLLLRIGEVLLERLAQLRARRVVPLVLGDPAAHPHHVGERPVGDAFAVREAAAAMPVGELRQAVEVLVELPREPGLADPATPVTETS